MKTIDCIREIRNARLYPGGVPLEVGCEMEYPKPKGGVYVRGMFVSKTQPVQGGCSFFYNIKPRNRVGLRRVCDSYCKILGKPVDTNDVLKMIQDKFDKEKQGNVIEMNGLGEIYYDCNDYNIEVCILDLSLPISDQSIETLTSIRDLIK